MSDKFNFKFKRWFGLTETMIEALLRIERETSLLSQEDLHVSTRKALVERGIIDIRQSILDPGRTYILPTIPGYMIIKMIKHIRDLESQLGP